MMVDLVGLSAQGQTELTPTKDFFDRNEFMGWLLTEIGDKYSQGLLFSQSGCNLLKMLCENPAIRDLELDSIMLGDQNLRLDIPMVAATAILYHELGFIQRKSYLISLTEKGRRFYECIRDERAGS